MVPAGDEGRTHLILCKSREGICLQQRQAACSKDSFEYTSLAITGTHKAGHHLAQITHHNTLLVPIMHWKFWNGSRGSFLSLKREQQSTCPLWVLFALTTTKAKAPSKKPKFTVPHFLTLVPRFIIMGGKLSNSHDTTEKNSHSCYFLMLFFHVD